MIHVAPPLSPASSRFLPAVADGFELDTDELLSVGLRRVSIDEFDRSISGLVSGSDLDVSIHEARKSMKRLRAMLRLVRDEIGEDRYRFENNLLRNTARLMGPTRDAAVLVETVGMLRDRFGTHLRRSAFSTLETKLIERHASARADLLDGGDQLRRVVHAMRSARARYRAWPVETEQPVGRHSHVVPHSFESLEPGLRRTYRRGRREMRVAGETPSGHNFHQWRKRVKYLRHQMELLRPTFPAVIDGYIAALDQLGEVLGEEHDLAELLLLVAGEPGLCEDAAERTLITALAQHRRSELQTAAIAIGRRVYAESPQRFVARIGAYWT